MSGLNLREISKFNDITLINTIVSWSKKVFPNLTPLAESKKLLEEEKEFLDSKCSIKEFVDILIVAIILKYRFNCDNGINIAQRYWHLFNKDDIIRELKLKAWKNMKRKWDATTNHHI